MESFAKVYAFAYWLANAEEVNVGLAANGKVVLPEATLTKGSVELFATNADPLKVESGYIVTKAVPSLMVVTGTYIVVAIWYI